MYVKKCTVCNIKTDKDNFKKDRKYVGTVTISVEQNKRITRSLEMIILKRKEKILTL